MNRKFEKFFLFLLITFVLIGQLPLVSPPSKIKTDVRINFQYNIPIMDVYGFTVFDSNIMQVTENNGNDFNPSIFMDNLGRLWMIWGNGSGNNGIIWATYAVDPFIEWITPFRLTDDPADDWNPVGITDEEGIIWIFWQSNRNGNYDIWYKNSSDSGRIWSQAYQLTNQITEETSPNVVVDRFGAVWVFYETINGGNKEIAYQKTVSGGRNWEHSQIIPICNNESEEEVYDACISETGSICLFVQELQDKWGTFVWISDDEGRSWKKYQVTLFDNCGWGSMCFGTTNLYVIYEHEMSLFLVSSSNINQEWTVEQRITLEDTLNIRPQCTKGIKGEFYIVWSSNRTDDWEIYLMVIDSEKDLLLGNEPFLPVLVSQTIVFGSLILFFIILVGISRDFTINRRSRIEIDNDLLTRIFSLAVIVIGNVIGPRLRRMSISQVQGNIIRSEILELLAKNEFMHLRELKRQTGTGMSQLKWHLIVLKDFGLIKERKIGQYLIYYLTTNPPDPLLLEVYFSLTTKVSYKIAKAFLKFNKWNINELQTFLAISKKVLLYHCEKLEGTGILSNEQSDFFILNDPYQKWVRYVIAMKKKG